MSSRIFVVSLALAACTVVSSAHLSAQRRGLSDQPLPAGQTNDPFPEPIVRDEGVITVRRECGRTDLRLEQGGRNDSRSRTVTAKEHLHFHGVRLTGIARKKGVAVAPHTLIQESRQRPSPQRGVGSLVFQLGWPHFWLVVFMLGTLLGLVSLIFFIGGWPR